jgi:hypothetical protein
MEANPIRASVPESVSCEFVEQADKLYLSSVSLPPPSIPADIMSITRRSRAVASGKPPLPGFCNRQKSRFTPCPFQPFRCPYLQLAPKLKRTPSARHYCPAARFMVQWWQLVARLASTCPSITLHFGAQIRRKIATKLQNCFWTSTKGLWKPKRGLPATRCIQPSFFRQVEKGADAVKRRQPTA